MTHDFLGFYSVFIFYQILVESRMNEQDYTIAFSTNQDDGGRKRKEKGGEMNGRRTEEKKKRER